MLRRLFVSAALFCFSIAIALSHSPIRLVDISKSSGIDAEIHSGSPERNWIPEANGTGVAWLDFDNDGLLDLLVLNGASMNVFLAVKNGQTPPPNSAGLFLYRNLGSRRFENVTRRAGLSNPYWATGANAADFNNDGFVDILVTTIGRDLLFKNNGNGTFTEVAKQAGLTQEMRWHTGSSFGDYDGDGFLDLYIAGYVALDALPFSGKPPTCLYRGVPGFCGPLNLKGEVDILYRNRGDGTFVDVTDRAQVTDSKRYHGFSVAFHDFDGDGKLDIFVANDSDPNYLYINRGDGTFRETALASGVGFNDSGQAMANMGIALGDYDNDGLIDVLTTVFSEDYFPLFRQTRPGLYEDVSARAGLTTISLPWVGWACGFTDFDNDGWKDLWLANGHVYPKAGMLGTTSYLQPLAILRNVKGKFQMDSISGDPRRELSHRGGASADIDNDGRIDLVVVPIDGVPLLLANDSPGENNWIGFHLRDGEHKRDALGASVKIEACGQAQTGSVFNGGSYLSAGDPRLHFGLGTCTSVGTVSIRWPNGKVQKIQNPETRRYHSITQPK